MKHHYQTLLFDADDTLLDFKAAEQNALRQLFASLSIELTDNIRNLYHTINHSLWQAFERGEISKDEILATRFRRLFAEINFSNLPDTLESDYQSMLASGHQTITEAFEVLNILMQSHDLYIVSNGVASTQYNRLKASGLYPYFKGVFVSEETGYQKPQIEFFDYVIARIPEFKKENTLIIGDSLSSDI